MSGETRSEPSSQTIALERIDSAPFQIRERIEERPLRELAASMRRCGLLKPIVVRPKGERVEVVAGERTARRSRSSVRARLRTCGPRSTWIKRRSRGASACTRRR